MKKLLVVATAVLSVGATGCGGGPGHHADPRTAPATPTASASVSAPQAAGPPAAATGIAYRVQVDRVVGDDVTGVALYGAHVAYLVRDRRLVWSDWRTGTVSTRYTARYGSLLLVRTSGRYAAALDEQPGPPGASSGSPASLVTLDLSTGRTWTTPLPAGSTADGAPAVDVEDDPPQTVGRAPQLGGLREVPHAGDRWRAALPGDDLLGQAAYDGVSRVIWTERAHHGAPDPTEVFTRNLARPGQPAVRLAGSGHSYSPMAGTGFVGWVVGRHLELSGPGGGGVVRCDLELAAWSSTSADGSRFAAITTQAGVVHLVVVRIG